MLGALLLAVSSWWQAAGDGGRREPLSLRLFPCRARPVGLFSAGILWQLVGYLRLEYTNCWTW